jgi:hypothetical protein
MNTAAIFVEQGLFDTESCHIWTGRTSNISNKTPVFDLNRVMKTARQVVWEHFYGPITSFPDGSRAFVLRTCNEPLCVNPKHCYVGTNQERVDMMTLEQKQRFREQNLKDDLMDAKRRRKYNVT